MTDLQGWQKVAREIGDYECAMKYIGSGEYIEDMREVTDDGCVGDWLPAEAAAKEILRLRERVEVLERLASANWRMIGALDKDRRENPDLWDGEPDPEAAEIECEIRAALAAAKPAENGAGGV